MPEAGDVGHQANPKAGAVVVFFKVFTNCIRLESENIVYGIRRYLRGAWMSLHVDVLPTHVLSAILQVIVVESLNMALKQLLSAYLILDRSKLR